MDWTLFEKGVFLVNLLGIIYDPTTKQILIGKRVNDDHFKGLSWVFPGGRPDYKTDLEPNLALEIQANTGLTVDVQKLVYAKTYPEKREFLSVYFLCAVTAGQATPQPGGNLSELKWIKPTDVTDYFTTSIHANVFDYLKTLE